MKNWLLGGLMAVCFTGSAFAATCSIGDIQDMTTITEINDTLSIYGYNNTNTDVDAVKGFVAKSEDEQESIGETVQGSTTQVARAVVSNIKPANGISLGGIARGSDLGSVDAMAAVAADGYNCGWEVWVNPFATWAKEDQSRRNNDVGYDADIYGANIGLTKRFSNFYVGAMFGYAHADVDADQGYASFDSENYTLGLFGGFSLNKFKIDMSAGYTWTDYEDYKGRATNINVKNGMAVWAKDYDGYSWFTSIKASYDFNVNCWTITPSIGWDYIHTNIDRYTMHFVDGTNDLFSGKTNNYSSRMPIMLKVARDFGAANIYVQGGYIREFNDSRTNGTYGFVGTGGQVMTARGRRPEQNFGTAGAGISGNIGRWKLGATYDYLWDGKDFDAHTVNGYVGITF